MKVNRPPWKACQQ